MPFLSTQLVSHSSHHSVRVDFFILRLLVSRFRPAALSKKFCMQFARRPWEGRRRSKKRGERRLYHEICKFSPLGGWCLYDPRRWWPCQDTIHYGEVAWAPPIVTERISDVSVISVAGICTAHKFHMHNHHAYVTYRSVKT